MKKITLLLFFICTNTGHSMVVKDPTVKPPKDGTVNTDSTKTEEFSAYNPYSLYVPSTNILKQLPPDRVMDMGATAYSVNFFMKALYFYTNAMALFPDNPNIYYWAAYETGFIYFKKKNSVKALEYFDIIVQGRNVPTTADKLARFMSSRVRNKNEYKTFLKQEDIIFLADKKARSALDRQIAKEERIAGKAQRELSKERKQREKEERKLLKEQAKEKQRSEKLQKQ